MATPVHKVINGFLCKDSWFNNLAWVVNELSKVPFFSETLTLILFHSSPWISFHLCIISVTLNQLVYLAHDCRYVWCVALRVTYGVNEVCCTGHMSSLAWMRTVSPFSRWVCPAPNIPLWMVTVLRSLCNLVIYTCSCECLCLWMCW